MSNGNLICFSKIFSLYMKALAGGVGSSLKHNFKFLLSHKTTIISLFVIFCHLNTVSEEIKSILTKSNSYSDCMREFPPNVKNTVSSWKTIALFYHRWCKE